MAFYELKRTVENVECYWGNKFLRGIKIETRDKVSYQVWYKLGYEIYKILYENVRIIWITKEYFIDLKII